MKCIDELVSKLRGEMSARMDDSDKVEILEVLQEAAKEIKRLNEYVGHMEHESNLLYGRLNNIVALASKEIK